MEHRGCLFYTYVFPVSKGFLVIIEGSIKQCTHLSKENIDLLTKISGDGVWNGNFQILHQQMLKHHICHALPL